MEQSVFGLEQPKMEGFLNYGLKKTSLYWRPFESWKLHFKQAFSIN